MAKKHEEVTDDAVIGKRVEQARGKTSQTEVARQMKEMGHKWSQATVWGVESGKRSLKLAEARDLATIFGCSVLDLVDDASSSDAYRWLRGEIASAIRASEALLDTLIEWYARRMRLFEAAQVLSEAGSGETLPAHKRDALMDEVISLSNFTMKDMLDGDLDDYVLARLETIDDQDPPPFELLHEVNLVRDDWRQLQDPQQEVRWKQLIDQVNPKDSDGLDS